MIKRLLNYVILILIHVSVLSSYIYDQHYYNKALNDNQSVGVLIVAFNRPEYFKQLIASIEATHESQILPFYFMLDGGPKACQKELSEIIKASSIKYKYIIARERNYGCAKNHIDGRRFMFDWCNYERVIEIEEDVVISPYYFKVLLSLDIWARKKYVNIGVTQCYSTCLLSKDEKKQKLNMIEESGYSWWSFVTHCIHKDVWDTIKSLVYEYEKFIDLIPLTEEFALARSKPARSDQVFAIRNWMRTVYANLKRPQFQKNSITATCDLSTFICSNYFEPNQDIMMGTALWLNGYVKIHTIVNRVKHIGEFGITVDTNLFQVLQHDKIVLDVFEEDLTLESFTFR